MTNILLDPLNKLGALSQVLFQSLSPPQTKPPNPPPLNAFSDCDAALAAALELARTHQVKQRKIETLKDEVVELEMKWREVLEKLETGRRELEVIVDEGQERIKTIERAKEAAVPYPDLLSYAQQISSFTSAPPNLPKTEQPSMLHQLRFRPPFPNEADMQRGHLYNEAPLGPLGETHPVAQQPREPTPPPAERDGRRGRAADYRPLDNRPHPQTFDLDLDLNPDL
ncbi:unnamed protein product [Peniophora sp. CBMAI 1063]|nr:unnamed protein product [Peniophora sp. CBMAI 1063]